jgi:uracil-DNA glycosylase
VLIVTRGFIAGGFVARGFVARGFVERLAHARIGHTFNFYRGDGRAALLRERLAAHLEEAAGARVLLVAEAPGYRGTRVSGVPLTSERQLTGSGPAEATATIVHGALQELGLTRDVLLWNVVPTHPGDACSNRRPTSTEIAAGLPFVLALARGRQVVPVGRIAHDALGGTYVRHPSHGGAAAFREGLERAVRRPCRPATIERRRAKVRPFHDEDLQRQAW